MRYDIINNFLMIVVPILLICFFINFLVGSSKETDKDYQQVKPTIEYSIETEDGTVIFKESGHLKIHNIHDWNGK